MVISVGIDVSKDKHDCFIVSSEGEVLADVFTIPNNMDGFHCLLQKIQACAAPQDKIKVGLEATGHYSYKGLRRPDITATTCLGFFLTMVWPPMS